ncbi:MAG: hypothetical protein Hyperionvirus29_29 [Hyperionvirus sp.]|uniref:Uncharacterized protein n=1 Tax=Hyperionvirus sp. TaxID=2487770 RepID=A0A3G5ABI0_9VIRU|nr:MAG: hypothetical protein Hyperionvirus29_29 [Hyperionvirus sp.]
MLKQFVSINGITYMDHETIMTNVITICMNESNKRYA